MENKVQTVGKGISEEKESGEQLRQIQDEVRRVVWELLEASNIKQGQILVVGCSSSEIASHRIGSYSSAEIGQAV